MEGVTILATTTVNPFLVFSFAMTVCGVLSSILLLKECEKIAIESFVILLALVIISLLVGLLSLVTGFKDCKMVTVDKQVSFVEFHEEYEIVSTKGDMYTVTEIEGEK